jgi:hypothetical protein
MGSHTGRAARTSMQAVAIIGDGVRLGMLRLTELKLPLDHAESEIKAAVLKRLQIEPQDLVGYSVFRRAADGRKRSAISLIYTLDIEAPNFKAPGHGSRNSKNSKANRIETMKGPAESGQICSVGRRKIAKKIAKNKRCYANTLRPRSRMLLKVMKGG